MKLIIRSVILLLIVVVQHQLAAGIKATPDLVELKQNVNNINYTLNTLMKQKITLNKTDVE